MLIRNATEEQIRDALDQTNEDFDSNIRFKRLDAAGNTRAGDPKHTVTLTVNDSRAAGGRRSNKGRRIAAACWHAHGTFMDALPEDCEIVVAIRTGREVKRPGDPWQDFNIGSDYYPMYYSEACDCNGSW